MKVPTYIPITTSLNKKQVCSAFDTLILVSLGKKKKKTPVMSKDAI